MIQKKKNTAAKEVKRGSSFYPVSHICGKGKEHGHGCDPDPHDPGKVEKGTDEHGAGQAQGQTEIPLISGGSPVKFFKKMAESPFEGTIFMGMPEHAGTEDGADCQTQKPQLIIPSTDVISL